MKVCTYCGARYSDEAVACANDGYALRLDTPAIPATIQPLDPNRQHTIDAEHIRLLSIFHFIVAGMLVCGLAFLCVHYLVMSTVFANPEMFKAHGNAPSFPKDFFKVFIWFYVVFGGVFLTAAILNFLAGLFLRQKRHRTFCLVVAGLNCLQVPFGTILGFFTIMVLSRDSVREMFL